MGCDIHTIAQIKKDDQWETCGPIFRSQWPQLGETWTNRPYDSRNYVAYQALAGIRGTLSIDPITEPRGLPTDFDPEDVYMGDHTYSWVTLHELVHYDWWQQIEHDQMGRFETIYDVTSDLQRSKIVLKTISLDPNFLDVRMVFGFDS